MGTFQSFRKAYGALKDSTKVGLAKVNSEFKDLDIAIVKATNHVECPPKERHVRKIFTATSVVRPRADVAYCIHALAKRLSKTRNWIVALKTLIVVHRTLREGDPTFREELLNYSHRGHILQISNFKDDSSPLAWDCSAWVRTYALFLEERLECYRILKYDIESERLTKTSPGSTKVHSRTRLLNSDELLEQLPALQQLLYRLMGCQPEGGAYSNYLIQYALALVLKESFKIYCAINDGIINLVDMFFDMPRHDAVKALNIYKRASNQAENLADFYEYCKGLELARTFQFPTLKQPPPSFLSTMEEYIREAPQTGSVNKRLEYREAEQLTQEPDKPEEPSEVEKEVENVEDNNPLVETEEEPQQKEEEVAEPPPLIATNDTSDLLGLNEINPRAAEIEESNALALAIITNGNDPSSSNRGLSDIGGSGWELALVTTPSNNAGPAVESRLAGGFDKLLLDSLYEDEQARRHLQLQNAGYGPYGEMMVQNPFEQHDPFSMSSNIAPPPNVQMAMMAQQQQMLFQHQQQQPLQSNAFPQQKQQQQQLHSNDSMMMVPYQQQLPQYPQQQMQQIGPNPFGDPFLSFPQTSLPPGGNHNLI
ncbi:putative clathrin assembly protein At5g57200 [Benincasa hispida]|uniref:putative clathrin assembly protein At5g57200 n=1 Tax=Benincasa hispida TaxID=102211 RepID=UPI0019023DE4|nr:putative clathrin assembly protein At5g57200 [Benincasa hispida]